MDVVSSAAAFAQAAEQCIKIARIVVARIQAYRHADDRIAELVIRVESIWAKTESQLIILSKITYIGHERLRLSHQELIRRLITKLYAAHAELETFTENKDEVLSLSRLSIHHGPWKRFRFSLLEKHLRRTVDDLKAWHAEFDPSWFLIILSTDSCLDVTLQEQPAETQEQEDLAVIRTMRRAIQESKTQTQVRGSVFRDEDFVAREQTSLPFSSLAITSLTRDGMRVIIDTTAYPEEVVERDVTVNVRDLARILSHSQPWTLGLLQCEGVMKKRHQDGGALQFQYVFSVPPGAADTTCSLRGMLLKPPVSLDAKYAIAKSLTRGVVAVHCADFVHKNIRPENILVFPSSAPEIRTEAYLVGFERTRPVTAHTSLTGDMFWERNIYRHPNRQGMKPEDIYVMQHDIYSLGVCLLEIGLWTSFVIPSDDPQPGPSLPIAEFLGLRNSSKAALEIKRLLIDITEAELPSLMGRTYTEIVLSCLTCLDPATSNMFADAKDLYDEDGILVGIVFIEKILVRLGSISV